MLSFIPQVPVVFFSLLRKGTPDRDRSEAKLAEAFDYMASQLRSLHKLPVSYVALDWHQMDKELGSEALVEGFWAQLSSLLPTQVGLGTFTCIPFQGVMHCFFRLLFLCHLCVSKYY